MEKEDGSEKRHFMQTNMKKDTVTGEYDLLEKITSKPGEGIWVDMRLYKHSGKGTISKRDGKETRLRAIQG